MSNQINNEKEVKELRKTILIFFFILCSATSLANNSSITIMAVGDINPQILKEYPDSTLTDLADLLGQADITLGNLESPLTNSHQVTAGKNPQSIRASRDFVFRSDPSTAQKLTYLGLNIFNLANNHIMDYGKKGLTDTLKTLDSQNLSYFGAGANILEGRKPLFLDCRGIRVAFLGYSEVSPLYASATSTQPGIASLDYPTTERNHQMLKNDISKARKKGAKIILISLHWGTELATQPDPYQKDFARYLIDQGADIIIGHHPHVLQPIELYKGKIIAYSLGNFIFWSGSPLTEKTEILKIALEKDNGQWRQSYQIIPMTIRGGLPRLMKLVKK